MKHKYRTTLAIGFSMIVVTIILASLAILFSSSKEEKLEYEQTLVYRTQIASVYRIHDDEKNVTCWVSPYGLSCIPDSQIEQ